MGIQNLEELLNPVSEDFRNLASHDSNDRWLVEVIGFDKHDYQNATHVLIGCPQDEGVRRNNGRTGAAQAPDAVRERLYRLQVPQHFPVKLFDAGNINVDVISNPNGKEDDPLIRVHQNLTKTVKQFLKDGKKVIALGGGNDISYADARALSEVYGEISAINIDAHLDMRIANMMTSGTPYRLLIEEGFLKPSHFHEFGIRPETNAAYYLKHAAEMGVNIHYLQDILANGAAPAFGNILQSLPNQPLFLGLDMDCIQAADAPGVSASSPVGFSAREVFQLLHQAAHVDNLMIFEITEANPSYDIDGRTSKLAAHFIYEFLKA